MVSRLTVLGDRSRGALLAINFLLCLLLVVPSAAAQSSGDAAADSTEAARFPFDVAGYVGFRYLNDDDLNDRDFYREYSTSIFLSKTIGRWRFHSEFNATTAPEYDADGIHLFPPRPSLSVKLETGALNYNFRDWLQIDTGFLFVPTYWREHRYQSNTLIVDDPLIDQTIFATAFRGGMILGDKYFEDGGFSYQLYGGVDQQDEFEDSPNSVSVEHFRAVGGKFVFHVPTRHFFDTFDLGFHRLHQWTRLSDRDEYYGGELHLAKGRSDVLAEFAHGSIDAEAGSRRNIRQGFYILPSYRIARNVFLAACYERLNFDSRFPNESDLARQTLGVTVRPLPALSIKLDLNRYQARAGYLPAYYGVTAGIVYFFHFQ